MAEDLTATADTAESTLRLGGRSRTIIQIGLVSVHALLTLVLMISRTEPSRFLTDGLLFFFFLLTSVACAELDFALSPQVTADLGGMFTGAAVLTLGFNGVWVSALSSLYSLLKQERARARDASLVSRLVSYALNLSLTSLPPWLGLFVYHDLLGGTLPLADLGANLVPALLFVMVEWLTLVAGMFPHVILAEQGLKGSARWFRGLLVGFSLSFFVPTLFSPAVAVMLNRLGLGFFLFISAGLLGISLMAQRLARSLAAERRRVEELTALNALSDDIIHNPPSVETTGELLAKHGPRFLSDADFQLCLFDGADPALRRVVVDWRSGAAQPTGDAPLTPAWTWLCQQRKPLYVADLERDSLPFAWDERADGPPPGSLLLVPLLAVDPARPEAERSLGGILITHARPAAFAAEALPSVKALANQLAAALENARLQQAALARERLERELVLARGIQTSFLPADVPQVEGWNFAASLEPARHVSGDFYDFIPLPGGRWGVLIADVADKGMPAALYMALARTMIRAYAPDHAADPAACLLAANDQILTDTQSDLFVTVFYGILDPTTGALAFCNAGHNPPYLCHRDGQPVEPLRNTGMALGVMPGVSLDNGRASLGAGDYLVLYTDGVTEAHDRDLREFGSERLLTAIAASDGAAAETLHHRVRAAVAEFVGDAPQFDDLTLMVVDRKSQNERNRDTEK